LNENIEIPGVEKTLATLCKEYSMAIVTTSKRKDFELIHKNRSIVKFMDFVLTVEDYSNAKPDPEPYLAALQKYGAITEEALIIEDSGRGLKSAVAAGIDCIIVENEFTSTHDFADAEMVLKSISELIKILIH
jgi:HAD superfamily hydrolase (TIGR01509 family)